MNLPNKLTMVRIALVPLVVIVYLCIGDNFWVMDETSGLAFRDVLVFIIFGDCIYNRYAGWDDCTKITI